MPKTPEPWVKPYERERLADPIMKGSADPLSGRHREHVQRLVNEDTRVELGSLPRAVNFISGPSRTGDIEQTIVLGAHGPFRVHILLVG